MSFGKRKKNNILEELSENTIDDATEKTHNALEELKSIDNTQFEGSYESKQEEIQNEEQENARLRAEKEEKSIREQEKFKREQVEKETEIARQNRQKQINEEQSQLTNEQKDKLSKYLKELQNHQAEIAKNVDLFQLVPSLQEAAQLSITHFEDNEVSTLASELQKMDQRSERKEKAKDNSRARRTAEESRLDALYNEQETQRIAEVRQDIKEQRENEKKNVRVTESNMLNQELYEIEENEKEKLTSYSNAQTDRIRLEKEQYIKMCKESLNSILGR